MSQETMAPEECFNVEVLGPADYVLTAWGRKYKVHDMDVQRDRPHEYLRRSRRLESAWYTVTLRVEDLPEPQYQPGIGGNIVLGGN